MLQTHPDHLRENSSTIEGIAPIFNARRLSYHPPPDVISMYLMHTLEGDCPCVKRGARLDKTLLPILMNSEVSEETCSINVHEITISCEEFGKPWT